MKIVSVNVGLPREVIWRGMNVFTGIFKQSVDGPVRISQLNLAADKHADLTVHGGADTAVYAYPAERYEYRRHELRDVAFSRGQFGEEPNHSGAHGRHAPHRSCLRVGCASLMVTQPRMPCYKSALRFGRDDMIKRFLISGRSGFYFSVIEPGSMAAGAEIEILSRDPN